MDKIAVVNRQVRHAEWAAQIQECRNSGLTVQQWCDQNRISIKTYYYRLRKLREDVCQQVPFPIGTAIVRLQKIRKFEKITKRT